MLNLALFGPPGAGKGTQSRQLVERFNLCYISTGDMLRKELTAGTDLGKQAQDIIASGGLVSDEIIVQILEKTIVENPNANGFLFDGFPRTTIQAYILDGLMIRLNTQLDCLINLQIPDETAVSRLIERGKTSGRSDDHEEVIRNRLREYHDKTHPVLDYYAEKGVREDVDGTQSMEAVEQDVTRIAATQYSKRPIALVCFGYPGSGRGSQARALADTFGLELVATGKMLEDEMKQGTEAGEQIRSLYENGQLVQDDIVIPLIEKKIADSNGVRGFIFKGFPRTLVQSYILDGLLMKHGCSLSRILEIEVPMLILMERLAKRADTDAQMPYDSSTERIVRRLREHEEKTLPVIRKYEQQHGLITVDGNADFDTVFERCASEVEALFQLGSSQNT